MICLSVFYASANDTVQKRYEDIMYEKFGINKELMYQYVPMTYMELYDYHSESNSDDIPEYALIKFCSPASTDVLEFVDLGPYTIVGVYYELGTLGYHIYSPATDTLYTLQEAFDMNLDGIEKVFTDSKTEMFYLRGDSDDNMVLNVKDATAIHKAIAGSIRPALGDFDIFVSDFNRDREINIKDATAIQKHIAGLEY